MVLQELGGKLAKALKRMHSQTVVDEDTVKDLLKEIL